MQVSYICLFEPNNYCGRAAQGHGDILNRITTPCFYCENLLKSGIA